MSMKEYLKVGVENRDRRIPMSLRQSWVTCELHIRLELPQKDKKEYLNIILESQIIFFALSIY